MQKYTVSPPVSLCVTRTFEKRWKFFASPVIRDRSAALTPRVTVSDYFSVSSPWRRRFGRAEFVENIPQTPAVVVQTILRRAGRIRVEIRDIPAVPTMRSNTTAASLGLRIYRACSIIMYYVTFIFFDDIEQDWAIIVWGFNGRKNTCLVTKHNTVFKTDFSMFLTKSV